MFANLGIATSLLSILEVLGLTPTLGWMNTCDLSTQEERTGREGVESHSWLYSRVKASLGYKRPASKERKKNQ